MVKPYDISSAPKYTPANNYSGPVRTQNLSIEEVGDVRPELASICMRASEQVGRLTFRGQPLCCGLLVGMDRVLVPLHAIAGSCPSDLTITFDSVSGFICIPKTYQVIRFLECDERDDYCLLQVACGADRCYPGNYFPIPRIGDAPQKEGFFLVHTDSEGALVVSLGKSCQRSDYQRNFCSECETSPGSSGGIHFDCCGNPFAMHVARYNGVCGQSSVERKAVFLCDIFCKSPILSRVHSHDVICPPSGTPVCMPMIAYQDICSDPERHGTLQATFMGSKLLPTNKALRVADETFKQTLYFLSGITTTADKIGMYARFWSNTSTLYRIDQQSGLRLDAQMPLPDACNLQIQVGGQTIATLIISHKLRGYSNQQVHKMAELVNYALRKFEQMIMYTRATPIALEYRIDPL